MPERRGPKPISALSVVPILPGTGRPPAPDDLSRLEKEVWKSVTDGLPPRWFGRELWPLLRVYCTHSVIASQLTAQWRATGYDEELGKQLDRETASLIKLARALRITKLTRTDRNMNNQDEAAIRNCSKKRLWEE
jgi:hypothetical protein